MLNFPLLVCSAPAGTKLLFLLTAKDISSMVIFKLSDFEGSIIASRTSILSPDIFASSTSARLSRRD